jgi:hypothetical protein
LLRQHLPQPSQRLSHSEFVILSNGLRFQNGISASSWFWPSSDAMLLSSRSPAATFVGRRDYRVANMHKPNLPPIAIHPVIAAALAVGLASAKPRLAKPRLSKSRPAETAGFADKTRSRSAQS